MGYPDPKYFDYSATSPPFIEALDRFKEVSIRYYGNPSSSHKPGSEAKQLLMGLKEKFCNLLNFKDGRLLICSSGTEANNTVIEGQLRSKPQARILMAENVHDSIWYVTEKYKKSAEIIEIENDGLINTDKLIRKLNSSISLLCINHVCNETGVIQDVVKISELCSFHNIRLLVDGVQAVGHVPVDMDMIRSDYYSFSAHKFGGPRSFGGLLIRDGDINPLMYGGKQEWNLRAGTENLGGLAATVVALEKSLNDIEEETKRLNKLKDELQNNLRSEIPGILINSSDNGKPGFLSVCFPGLAANELVSALSIEGFSVSTGSACHDNLVSPSRIIMALGRSASEAKGTIRIGMGRGTTSVAVKDLLGAICEIIKD